MKKSESIILNIAIAGMILLATYFVSNDMIAEAWVCIGLSILGIVYVATGEEKTQSPEQSNRRES